MKTIVVLGMHRSGTSCVAHMLHELGVFIGENLLSGNPDNLDGHFEFIDAMRINEEILVESSGTWDAPPDQLRAKPETLEKLCSLIARLSDHPISGWKEPRTVITYPIWKPFLGDHWILACLRNPDAVARSLETRHGWPKEKGYQLWFQYNSRLVEYVRSHEKVLWFDYDRSAREQQSWLRHACEVLELNPTSAALSVFDRFQKHHAPEPSIHEECGRLYEQLKEMSASQWTTPAESTLCDETHTTDCEVLARLHGRHNAILQRTTRIQHEFGVTLETFRYHQQVLQNCHQELHTKHQELQSSHERLIANCEDMSANYKRLRTSHETLSEAMVQAEEQTESLQSSIDLISNQIMELEGAKEVLTRQSGDLHLVWTQVTEKLESLSQDFKLLVRHQAERDSMLLKRAKYDAAVAHHLATLNQRISASDREIGALKQRLTEFTDPISLQHTEMKVQANSLRELSDKVQYMQKQIVKMRQSRLKKLAKRVRDSLEKRWKSIRGPWPHSDSTGQRKAS